jgi:hypothetical protein
MIFGLLHAPSFSPRVAVIEMAKRGAVPVNNKSRFPHAEAFGFS